MKGIILLIMIFMLFSSVFASPSAINIINVGYNDGDMKIFERYSTVGYYPEPKHVKDSSYLVEVISEGGSLLYSGGFDEPNVEYLDGHDGGYNLGGKKSFEKYNFSLVVPSFENEKLIRIRDDKNKEKASLSLEEKREHGKWIFLAAILIGLISMISYIFSNQKFK